MLKKMKLLLAAVGVSVCAIASTPANAVSLINGGFESDVGLTGGQWSVYPSGIPGWSVIDGAGIEIQNGNIGGTTAYEGNQKVELDSHGRGSNSHMAQTVSLAAGSYEFSFAYFGRTADAGTNGIGYSLSPGVLGISSVTGVKAAGWTLITHMFNLASDSDVTINFWANGDEDTLGGYIDAVQISAVPLPSSVLLFGASLLGLGWLGRRRKQAALAA